MQYLSIIGHCGNSSIHSGRSAKNKLISGDLSILKDEKSYDIKFNYDSMMAGEMEEAENISKKINAKIVFYKFDGSITNGSHIDMTKRIQSAYESQEKD